MTSLPELWKMRFPGKRKNELILYDFQSVSISGKTSGMAAGKMH